MRASTRRFTASRTRRPVAQDGWKQPYSPLAADLEELTGQPVVVSGPFGLRAAVYIKLGKSTITITPGFQDDRLELYYDTGRATGRYEPLTLGDFNGFNNEQARLPERLEDVAALFHKEAAQ